MILAVNPNTGIDYTLVVPHLHMDHTIRSEAAEVGMGGKAIDAAWILGKLGAPVKATGFAAGFTGAHMEQMLHQQGVLTDFVWAGGESRLNIVLVLDDRSGQSTITASGLRVSPGHAAQLIAKVETALDDADCVILGGSLPDGCEPSFYRSLIGLCNQRQVPVIFDASGQALQSGLEARPWLVKPNRDELYELTGIQPDSIDTAYLAVCCLREEYGSNVIATLGPKGAIAVTDSGAYRIPPLEVPVVSTAGAGDGVLAGIALAVLRGESILEGLLYGFSLAGAIVQTLATAGFRLEDYQSLLNRVTVQPYRPTS